MNDKLKGFKFLIFTCGFTFCLFNFKFATAAEFAPKGPLTVRNQNPIYLEFLNLEPTRAVALPVGQIEFRIDSAYSNIFEEASGGTNNTAFMFDMELLRTAFHLNAGVYDGMEVGLELAFMRLDNGFLDSFIQKFHNFFHFPNGGRENFPNDQYHYWFSQNGAVLYQVPKKQPFELGDLTFSFKHNFLGEGDLMPAVAWLFYFKFPTGSLQDGTSSGNPDFGLGAAFEKNYGRWHGYLNLAYFTNGGQEPLQNYIYDQYFTYMIGGEFSVSHPVSLNAQITGGTPLLHGVGKVQWDSFPMDLQLGARGEHPLTAFGAPDMKLIWQGGFTEDLNPNGPSIDFTIFGSVGVKFNL